MTRLERRWRYSAGYWYWEDDRYDYGHVWRIVEGPRRGRYAASCTRTFSVHVKLKDAKEAVERGSS